MSKPYSSYDSASNLMVNYLPANMDESEFRSLFEAIGSLRFGYVIIYDVLQTDDSVTCIIFFKFRSHKILPFNQRSQ